MCLSHTSSWIRPSLITASFFLVFCLARSHFNPVCLLWSLSLLLFKLYSAFFLVAFLLSKARYFPLSFLFNYFNFLWVPFLIDLFFSFLSVWISLSLSPSNWPQSLSHSLSLSCLPFSFLSLFFNRSPSLFFLSPPLNSVRLAEWSRASRLFLIAAAVPIYGECSREERRLESTQQKDIENP